MINPYNIFHKVGVANGRTIALPNNYAMNLDMNTWWSAVQRARLYSDFTGLDALYSYIMKSSTIVRAAVEKRLRPLKARTFSVVVNGKLDERLTQVIKDSTLVRELVYNKGLSNFVYARVVGVTPDMEPYVYPLRNLDVVNRAVKYETYDYQGDFKVESHVNLFWMQTSYNSEDTLGLLEPIARDYINLCNAQNNWQTASQFLAYQQMMLYFENGDEKMAQAAMHAASQIGLGQVIVSGKTTNEDNGKVEVIKDLELENVVGTGAADTFRIFKENIDSLAENIAVLVLGSSLLLRSAKNTNSERLVRAHLKGFYDICEADAIDVQDWLNKQENKTKLAYLLKEPTLATAAFRVEPTSYIDIGDVETYVAMLKELQMSPTDTFVEKTGLDIKDVVGYEDSGNTQSRSKAIIRLRDKANAPRSVKDVVVASTKRLFGSKRSGDGGEVE